MSHLVVFCCKKGKGTNNIAEPYAVFFLLSKHRNIMVGILLLKQILLGKEKEVQRKFCKQNHNCINFFC